MARVRAKVARHARRRKVIVKAKGYWGRRKNTFRAARQAVERAAQYAYRDRRARKRDMRSLWIQRINAAVREENLTYGRFMSGLAQADIKINRKMLADLAISEPEAFKSLVEQARAKLS